MARWSKEQVRYDRLRRAVPHECRLRSELGGDDDRSLLAELKFANVRFSKDAKNQSARRPPSPYVVLSAGYSALSASEVAQARRRLTACSSWVAPTLSAHEELRTEVAHAEGR